MKYRNALVPLVLLLIPTVVSGSPVITSVDNSNYSSGEISIMGTGFGPSANVLIFDQFESDVAAEGGEIPLTSPVIGKWNRDNRTPPLYNAIAHSGKFSAQMFKKVFPPEPAGRMRQFKLDFPTGVQEIFISYWVRLPDGAKFPSLNVLNPGEFPNDSSWKFTWLYDLDVVGDSSDICLPTHVGYGKFYLAGNDSNLETKLGNSWWSWSSWMRIAIWLRADSKEPTSYGDVLFQTISSEKGLSELWLSSPVFDADGPALKQYQHLNVPGWIREESDQTATPLYDDIYLATGDNAMARVELTDSEIYEDARKIAIQIPLSWTETQIEFNVNKGDFEDIKSKETFLFVWDKDGSRNSKGIQVFPSPMPPSTVTAD